VAERLTKPTSPLFINWNGDVDKKVGRKVTSFFEDKNDLHMTSTAIRGLMETTAEEALLRGDITATQRASVSSLNGHSSEVVKNYYLKVRTAKDVKNARDAVIAFDSPNDNTNSHGNTNNLCSHFEDLDEHVDSNPMKYNKDHYEHVDSNPMKNDDDSDDDVVGRLFEGTQVTEYADWGTEHPDYKSLGSRATWSRSELLYIYQAAKGMLKSNQSKTNIVARILIKIKSDPLALSIFHARHVLKSDRLRSGYKKIEDKLKIN
jgi:hypothetical protein